MIKTVTVVTSTCVLVLSSIARAGGMPPADHERYIDVPHIKVSAQRDRELPARLPGTAPLIDGALDDAAWQVASVSRDFWVSGQDRAPANRTEVLVVRDDANLYFGFRLYESDLGAITATREVRDTGLGYDDSIEIQLDTFLNYRDISSFSVNPVGTQSDEIAGGRSSKVEWKGDWQGAARRTDYGWSAEVAIPFAILNYRPGDTRFGVNFRRYQSRTKEYSYWADVTPQNRVEEMGQLRGLNLRAPSTKQAWTLMPFALVGKNIPDRKGEIQDKFSTAGIDIRYQPRQDLTAMISLNPDFSQVEEAVTDISFSYSEKELDENRPFFVEGAGYFSSEKDDNQYFYSNRVADFDVGAKSFGRIGRTKIGLLATKAPNDRLDLVSRALYELNATNSAMATIVSTRQLAFDNLLGVAQFRGRQSSGFNYSFDAAITSTTDVSDPDIVDGNGSHYQGAVGWSGDDSYVWLEADEYEASYFPANALLDDDLPGTRGGSLSTGYFRERSGPFWRKIDAYVGARYRETDAGRLQERGWYSGGSVEFNTDMRFGFYAEDGPYRPVTDTVGEFEDELNEDRYYSTSLDLNTRSSRISGGLRYAWGGLGGANYEYMAVSARWRPLSNLYLKLSGEKTRSVGTFEQLVFVGSWDISPEYALGGRYINNESGDWYRLAFSRRARKGLDIFAVYDNRPFRDNEYSLKLVYTLSR